MNQTKSFQALLKEGLEDLHNLPLLSCSILIDSLGLGIVATSSEPFSLVPDDLGLSSPTSADAILR